jgi:hypothetical protein
MCTPPLPAKRWAPLFLSGLLFAACSPKLAPVGHYQDTPVAADGQPGDWALPLRFSNQSYTVQYNVTNDNNNLYVAVSSTDDATMFRILRNGMTLYFDPKGDKGKDISLHFPIQKQPDPGSRSRDGYNSGNNGNTLYYQNQGSSQTNTSGGNTTGTANRDTRKEELLLQSDYYNTAGFLDLENGQFGVTDQKGPIHVAMKLNNNDSLLLYEVVIPLKNILGADWAAKAAKKNFSVGVVLDAVAGTGGNGGGGGMHGGGGGFGMRGMGMGGMRGGGMGGQRQGGGQQGKKEDASWYAFRLATK